MNPCSLRRLLPALAPALLGTGLAAQIRFDPHAGCHLATMRNGLPLELNAIASGDVDGDGDVDLLLADNIGYCRICFCDGNGDYRRFVEIPVNRARQAVLADVDGDGDLDALLAGGMTAYSSGFFASTLLRNDGLGVFTPSNTLPLVTRQTIDLAVVDLDGDGDRDAVVFGRQSNEQVQVHCWRNDGTGTFVDVTATAFPGQPTGNIRRGFVADLDGDTFPDIVTYADAGECWYRNDGAGHFAQVAGWSLGGGAQLLGAADLDGDGDVDLLTAGGFYANNGAGAFAMAGTVPTTLLSPFVSESHIAFADFDGDGRLDVAGTEEFARPFQWLRGSGSSFVDATAQWFDANQLVNGTLGRGVSYAFGCCAAFDADGDGDPDLATGGAEGRVNASTTVGIPPRVFANAGRQGFVDTTRAAMPWFEPPLHSIAVGDVDRDGDADLVLNGQVLLLQDAAGRFTHAGGLPAAPTFASSARLADLDGDGDLDLLAARGADPGTLSGAPAAPTLARNDGSGHFADVSATALPVPPMAGSAVAVGDVDGDGDLDAVAGSINTGPQGGSTLHLWRNNGAGVFAEVPGAFPAPIQALAIELADLDGDGDLDVAAQLHGFPTIPARPISLWRNDGTGAFTDMSSNVPVLGVGTFGMILQAIDYDHDGDLDLTIGDIRLANNGQSQFVLASTGSGLLLVDLDEDGVLDQVSGGVAGVVIGGIGYSVGWSGSASVRPVVASADIDRDGDTDLIVGGQLFSVYATPSAELTFMSILFNERRSLRPLLQPILGRDCSVGVRAALPGTTVAFVGVDTRRLDPPLDLAPLGLLWLDPATFWLHAIVALPSPDTTAEVRLPVPPLPFLAGYTVAFQALLAPNSDLGAARLTSAPAQIVLR